MMFSAVITPSGLNSTVIHLSHLFEAQFDGLRSETPSIELSDVVNAKYKALDSAKRNQDHLDLCLGESTIFPYVKQRMIALVHGNGTWFISLFLFLPLSA